ncbi:hypothetical protein N431DRAFT_530964 [Stipitochalara longipes BDJ]|nr:hypothetical protein N431DRAFT_530964 [Stipitochalara longipes BDJ]
MAPHQPYPRPLLASSLCDLSSANPPCLIPYSNAFVIGIFRAFQQDLHLVLRPDDVWLAILTQFNFYVNGHAEEMRHLFVAHEGKKELSITTDYALLSEGTMSNFVLKMTCLIEEEVVDKKLRKWIMPDFSTTTGTDSAAASIVMMGTMQRYFDYFIKRGCGFPSVTLLGQKKDWKEILKRVGELGRYGKETKDWSALLKPVIKNMVKSFETPKASEIKDFWLKACHQKGQDGSGADVETISGWLTAFCFWDEKGKRIENADIEGQNSQTPYSERRLMLDDVAFPLICPRDIPAGLVSVPLKVIDLVLGTEQMTTMTAGLVGMMATKKARRDEGKDNRFQPRSGWWMLEESVKPLEKLPQHRSSH